MPVAIKSTGGGSVTMTAASTASDYTLTLPAVTDTVATTTSPTFPGTLTAAPISASGSISDSLGPVRQLPINSQTSAYVLVATDAGKTISITTGGVTVNTGIFSAGDNITIYNNSGSSQTITQGTATLRQAGTANTGNRTLAQYGVCTLLCVASGTFVISGSGLS